MSLCVSILTPSPGSLPHLGSLCLSLSTVAHLTRGAWGHVPLVLTAPPLLPPAPRALGQVLVQAGHSLGGRPGPAPSWSCPGPGSHCPDPPSSRPEPAGPGIPIPPEGCLETLPEVCQAWAHVLGFRSLARCWEPHGMQHHCAKFWRKLSKGWGVVRDGLGGWVPSFF